MEETISIWVSVSDNNSTAAHIQAVSQRLGADPRVVLNMRDLQAMSVLISNAIHYGNGRNIYSHELIGKVAVAGIDGTQVSQKNIYHIYGGDSPRFVGTKIGRRQQSANAQVMRDNQAKMD